MSHAIEPLTPSQPHAMSVPSTMLAINLACLLWSSLSPGMQTPILYMGHRIKNGSEENFCKIYINIYQKNKQTKTLGEDHIQ